MILEINTLSERPIYGQLRDQIIMKIASNQLKRGEALPSVRRLSADLGVNLHTVNKAYSVLSDEGYIVMDRRRGAMVANTVKKDPGFQSALAYRLTLSAAEARCRDISEEEFLGICRYYFLKTGDFQSGVTANG